MIVRMFLIVFFLGYCLGGDAAYAQENAEEITLSVVKKTNYTRLLFNANNIDYFDIYRDGKSLQIILDIPVAISVDGIAAKTAGYVTDFKLTNDGKSLQMILANDALRVRKFMGEGIFGIDLVGKIIAPDLDVPDQNIAYTEEATEEATEGVPTPNVVEEITPLPSHISRVLVRVPLYKPLESTYKIPLDKIVAENAKAKEKPVDEVKITENTEAGDDVAPKDDNADKVVDGQKLSGKEVNKAQEQEQSEGEVDSKTTKELLSEQGSKQASEPLKKPEKAQPLAKKPAPKKQEPKIIVPEKTLDNTLSVERVRLKDGLNFVFPWEGEVAAAAFSRGQYVWIVFNKFRHFSLDDLDGVKYLSDVKQFYNRKFSILRIQVDENTTLIQSDASSEKKLVYISVYKDSFTWMLSIREAAIKENDDGTEDYVNKSALKYPIAINVQPREDQFGSKVALPVLRASEVMEMKDTIAGGMITVVPLYHEGAGFNHERKFVEFNVLETVQGIAVQKVSDRVLHNVLKDGVYVYSSVGLSIPKEKKKEVIRVGEDYVPEVNADDLEALEARTVLHFGNEVTSSFPEKMSYLDIRRKLYEDIVYVDVAGKSQARLKLAKFLFEQEEYHEAYGVLRELQVRDSLFEGMNHVEYLLAAAKYLTRDYVGAATHFHDIIAKAVNPDIAEELAIWEWASQIKAREESSSGIPGDKIYIDFVSSYDKYMQKYPAGIIYDLGLMATEEEIDNDNLNLARSILAITSFKEPPKGFVNYLDYVRGRLAEKNNDIEEAIAIWSKLTENTDDRKYRAMAFFELAKLQLREGDISVDRVTEIFDQLSFVWRGGYFEIELLKLKGHLYVKKKKYIKGLRAWKSLTQAFPDTKEALVITGKMKRLFVRLFDRGEAYELPPISALALYFEFRDLTPLGPIGDRIILQLAEHFMKADLLDNAAMILEHQAKYRAEGKERYKIALQIADIQLKNMRPERTLDILEKFIEEDKVSAETLLRVKEVKARALFDLKRFDEIEKMFEGDDSEVADNMRLQLNWFHKEWDLIINHVENKLPLLHEKSQGEFSIIDADKIVKLAIAYARNGEHKKLQKLNNDFSGSIHDRRQKSILEFVSEDKRVLDFRDIDNDIRMDDLELFISEFAFWEAKDWEGVIMMLEPKIEAYKGKEISSLNAQEMREILQLSIAYSQKPDDENIQKSLNVMQRDFRDFSLDKSMLDVLGIFTNSRLSKESYKDFKNSIPIAEIGDFIEKFKAAGSMEELNITTK